MIQSLTYVLAHGIIWGARSRMALALPDGGIEALVVTTAVVFAPLSQGAIGTYLATPEPWDKAGAYGIQGLAGAFVSAICGSYSNVVGLPLHETWQLLARHGIGTVLEQASE